MERKLELPQLRQVEGLFVEQVAQLEKHLVQFVVPTIFTYPELQPPSSQLFAPALPQVRQLLAHWRQTPLIAEYPTTQEVEYLMFSGQVKALESVQPVHTPLLKTLAPKQLVHIV